MRSDTVRRIAGFYALTILFSWSYWGWMIATGRRYAEGHGTSHLPGLVGPMAAAIVLTLVIGGKRGLRAFALRSLALPSPVIPAIGVAVSPLIALLAVVGVMAASGQQLPRFSAYLAYPGVSASASVLVTVPMALLLNGFGEEAGWRGYLLDSLETTVGRFRATLVLIPLWLVWHIPLFVVNQNMTSLVGPTLVFWAIGLALGAFVLSHVYFTFGRSILMVALWHTSYNFAVSTSATSGTVAAIISTIVMFWGAIVAWSWARQDQRQQGGNTRRVQSDA